MLTTDFIKSRPLARMVQDIAIGHTNGEWNDPVREGWYFWLVGTEQALADVAVGPYNSLGTCIAAARGQFRSAV